MCCIFGATFLTPKTTDASVIVTPVAIDTSLMSTNTTVSIEFEVTAIDDDYLIPRSTATAGVPNIWWPVGAE